MKKTVILFTLCFCVSCCTEIKKVQENKVRDTSCSNTGKLNDGMASVDNSNCINDYKSLSRFNFVNDLLHGSANSKGLAKSYMDTLRGKEPENKFLEDLKGLKSSDLTSMNKRYIYYKYRSSYELPVW